MMVFSRSVVGRASVNRIVGKMHITIHAMAVTDCDEDENEKDNTSTGSHDSSIHYEFEPHTVQDYLLKFSLA